jgi:hypothetical protein
VTAPTTNQPACDPATLAEPCTGCNRRMHRGNSGTCQAGHPRHNGNNLCTGCASRARRAAQARAAAAEQARRPAAQVHPYCPHHEGERCHCARELRSGKEGISRR